MHRRTVRLAVAALAIMAMPAVVFAQSSRTQAMEVPSDYMKDYTNIYGWPSSLPTVGNLAYVELGNVYSNSNTLNPYTLDRGMGAVLGNLWDGRYGVWAIHMREETPALGQADNWAQLNPGSGGGDPNRNTNEQFDIMWGKKFGGTNFGLRFNRSYYQLKDELQGSSTNFEADGMAGGIDPNLARNVMGFGAGIGFDMNPNTSVELSAMMQNRTFELKSTSGSTSNSYENDGATNYLVAARAMWKWQSNVMVVPVFKWYSFDLSTKSVSTTTTTFDNSLKGWQIGVAGNWTLNQNDLFVLGMTFAQNKLDQQSDVFGLTSGGILSGFASDTLEATETFAPQIFGGLETHPNSWLTLRLGASKGVFHTYKVKSNGGTSETLTLKTSPFSINLGCGVKLGNLQVDALLDGLFAHNPLAQLMGGDQATYANSFGVAFPKVTATYAF
jgi:hypothetical protein